MLNSYCESVQTGLFLNHNATEFRFYLKFKCRLLTIFLPFLTPVGMAFISLLCFSLAAHCAASSSHSGNKQESFSLVAPHDHRPVGPPHCPSHSFHHCCPHHLVMADGVSRVSLCSEKNICQELARHDSGRNQASLPSAACICCLCIPCILPEQKKRLASADSSSTRWSQKQALSGQVMLSLSLLEVTLCQPGNKSELKAAGDRQSDAELMNFFVPKYKNNIWAVNIFVLRSKLFHLGTIIRLTSDLSGTDRTAFSGPKGK